MSELIGPDPCTICSGEYGVHEEYCRRHPKNRPPRLSKQIAELAKSELPNDQRLQVLIHLTAQLAIEMEGK